ncbi:hypothetical protein AYI68_g20 [Smittium mucronatum]|uniref:Uncharacterized protein n=1 Tax=Smittium mucronatum TaxID=133383 RepID=A0A1R0H9D8_9FUNG|nr:hypothetical protein AYI68_g20 [Smittium mucronatum]
MGMVMRNHELVESGTYPYWFSPEVEAWRMIAEDRDSDASAFISIDALELSRDLDPSVDLAGETVISGSNPPVRFSPIVPTMWAVKTLSVVSVGSNERSLDRWSKDEIPALNSLLGKGSECAINGALSVASLLAAQQRFRSDDMYRFNCYRESASENI